jgi:hypothetical protein
MAKLFMIAVVLLALAAVTIGGVYFAHLPIWVAVIVALFGMLVVGWTAR